MKQALKTLACVAFFAFAIVSATVIVLWWADYAINCLSRIGQ